MPPQREGDLATSSGSVFSGRQVLDHFLRCHEDGLHNPRIRRYLLSHEWTLAVLDPGRLPDWDDARLVKDDPYRRAIDVSESTVDRLVARMREGRSVAPAIADENGVFLDGNHRAVASRIAGKPLLAFVPVIPSPSK